MTNRERNPFAKGQLRSEATNWFLTMRDRDAEQHRAEFEKWLARGAMHRAAYNSIAHTYLIGDVNWDGLPPPQPVRGTVIRTRFALAGLLMLLACLVWRVVVPSDLASERQREQPAAAIAQAGHSKKSEAAPKSPAAGPLGCGCPGSAVRDLRQSQSSGTLQNRPSEPAESRLSNWPVQLRLVPENAPYLMGADLLIAADCTAFAHPDFHRTFLSGPNTVCLVGCPKLDDAQQYVDKIARMIERNEPASLTLVRMEVPCCGGMARILDEAVRQVGRDASLRIVTVGVRGDIIDRETKTWVFGTNA